MKKKIFVLLLLIVCCAPILYACGNKGNDVTVTFKKYSVTTDNYHVVTVSVSNDEEKSVILNKQSFYVTKDGEKIQATAFVVGFSSSSGTLGSSYESHLGDTIKIEGNDNIKH